MALEFYARAEYEYQGGDTIFSIPFPYINKAHVIVIVNDDTDNPINAYTWINETQIRINIELNTGDKVSIRRTTPINDKLVKFTDNNILDEETQNIAQDQVFNVMQEVTDNNNSLIEQMEEFVNIKDTVQYNLNKMEDVKQRAETVVKFDTEVKELINGISSTYEDLQTQIKSGLNVKGNKNLFSLEILDRTLNETESEGYCKQGSTFTKTYYPDAYDYILKEYETGEIKRYHNADNIDILRRYENEGEYFYTSDTDIEEGMNIYSDETLETLTGTVSNLTQLTTQKYNNDEGCFYLKSDDEIQSGTTIYNDKSLIEEKGIITNVQETSVTEYTLSTSGKVYFPSTMNLLKGRPVYEDKYLTDTKGVITKLETQTADKYAYTDSDGNELIFYVPANTIIMTGTEIFTDSALTQSAGNITIKGQQTSKYYYKATRNNANALYFYTKTSIPTTKTTNKTYLYTDSNCTKNYKVNGKSTYVTYISDNVLLIEPTDGSLSSVVAQSYNKVELITSGSSQNYIQVNKSEFKSAYYKQGTVTAEVIALDNGKTEVYELTSIFEGTVIEINDNEFSTAVYQGLETSIIFMVNEKTYTLTGYDLITTEGTVFEYRQAANGHKIIHSKYKDKWESCKTETGDLTFYILNDVEETVTLPVLDDTKYIYFVTGNTIMIRSAIQPVTKAYVDKNYATKEYVQSQIPVELWKNLEALVTDYNANIEGLNEAVKEIIGEED